MLERLYTLRREQEELDKKLGMATDQIKQKESLIKLKEQEKAQVQTDIKNDEQKHNNDFRQLRQTLQQQAQLIQTQRFELNKLQGMNEHTQEAITNQAREILKNQDEKNKKDTKLAEEQQISQKSKFTYNALSSQIVDEFPQWKKLGPKVGKRTAKCPHIRGDEPSEA